MVLMFKYVFIVLTGKLYAGLYSVLEISCEKITKCLILLYMSYKIHSSMSIIEITIWICRLCLYNVYNYIVSLTQNTIMSLYLLFALSCLDLRTINLLFIPMHLVRQVESLQNHTFLHNFQWKYTACLRFVFRQNIYQIFGWIVQNFPTPSHVLV
jgi:hypothetical protein